MTDDERVGRRHRAEHGAVRRPRTAGPRARHGRGTPGGTTESVPDLAEDLKDVVAAHVHCGPRGANGPVGVTRFGGDPVTPETDRRPATVRRALTARASTSTYGTLGLAAVAAHAGQP